MMAYACDFGPEFEPFSLYLYYGSKYQSRVQILKVLPFVRHKGTTNCASNSIYLRIDLKAVSSGIYQDIDAQ